MKHHTRRTNHSHDRNGNLVRIELEKTECGRKWDEKYNNIKNEWCSHCKPFYDTCIHKNHNERCIKCISIKYPEFMFELKLLGYEGRFTIDYNEKELTLYFESQSIVLPETRIDFDLIINLRKKNTISMQHLRRAENRNIYFLSVGTRGSFRVVNELEELK